MSKFAGRLFAVAICILPFFSAEAITRTWVGPNFVSWSNPNNWSPAGVPVDGDDIVIFSVGFALMTTTNDLPPGLVVKSLSLSSAALKGNSLIVTGDISVGGKAVIVDAPITLGASVHLTGGFSVGPGFADFDVNGKTLDLDVQTYFKQLHGSGTINGPADGGILTIDAGDFHGAINNGNVCVRGALSDADLSGSSPGDTLFPVLGGFGTVGNVDVAVLYPGYMSAIYNNHVTGTLYAKSLTIAKEYGVDLSSTEYDSVIASGPVTISGRLTLSPATDTYPPPPPSVGQNFVIIDNRGSEPVHGTFADLPEGAVVQFGNLSYRITYKGGDGNDVELLWATKPDDVLTQNAASTVTGEPVTLTASITSAYGTPAGMVTFTDNGNIIGTATLANGVATFQAPLAGVGSHSIVASYAGAGGFVGADSAPLSHSVGQGSTSTALTTVSTALVYGDAPMRVTALPVAPAAGVVGGEVTLLEGINVLGTATLDGGSIVISPVLTPGTHTLTASYAGSAAFLGSNSSSATVTIGPAPTRLDVSRDETAAAAGGVALNIFVNSLTAVPATPAGTITITDHGVVLTEQPIAGHALITLQLSAGHHTLSILYSGNENFLAGAAVFDVDVAAPAPVRHRGVHH